MDSSITSKTRSLITPLFALGWLLAFALTTLLIIWEGLVDARSRFEIDASSVKDALLQRLQFNVVMLDGIAALLQAEGYINRQETAAFAKDLTAHYPHVRALQVVQRVTPYNVPQLEKTMQGLGLKEFRVHEPASFDPAPEMDRSFLYPVVFAATRGSAGGMSLGADIYAHPVLRNAIDYAAHNLKTKGASISFNLGDDHDVLVMFRGVDFAAADSKQDFPNLIALLIVDPVAMVSDQREIRRLSVLLSYNLSGLADAGKGLWRLEQQAVGRIAASILPRLVHNFKLEVGGETVNLDLSRQLNWHDLPPHSIIFVVAFSVIAVIIAWLIVRSRTVSDLVLRTETALRASESKQLAVIDAIPDALLIFSREGFRLKFIASEKDELFPSHVAVIGKRLDELLPIEVAALYYNATERAGTTGQMETFEYAMSTPARGEQQFEARLIAGDDNEILAVVRNVTARKKVANVVVMLARQSVLIGSQDRFFEECLRTLAQFFGTGFAYISLVTDPEQRRARTFRVWAQGSFVENFDYDLHGTPYEDGLNLSAKLVRSDVSAKYPQDTHLQRMGVESYFGAPLVSSTGQMIGLVAVMDTKPLDVEPWEQPVMEIFATRIALELERKRTLDELKNLADLMSYQATHDALTDLVNRREFERRIEVVIETTRDSERQHAVLYLDLDQFKIVNDTCGHLAGDTLLKSLAAQLRTLIRDSDSIARLGGDEFGVLLEDCDLKAARMLANKLLAAVREFRFMWERRVFEIGVSIGVALVSRLSGAHSEILSAADAACYVAKELGRNRIHVYLDDDADLARRRREMHWVSEIRQAMVEDRLILYRQAIVPVSDKDRENEQHFEILLRLVDSNNVIAEPGMVINAAERYNLMVTIDRWVIERVFRHLHDVLDALKGSVTDHYPRTTYAINLSGTTLNDDQFSIYVEQLLQRYELPPQMVCFEITETAAITNLGNASRLIRQLKDIGCRFALDDFGVGFSSYGYLKNLPIDYVKIDGHFVKDILEDPLDLAIVESISHIGSVIGLRTIAEWVESDAILERVRQIGVDYVQGFALAMPEPLPKAALVVGSN